MKKFLFICTANQDRSKTAEDSFTMAFPNCSYKSAGTSEELCRLSGGTFVNQELIDWADQILVMEISHFEFLHAHFQLNGKHLHVLTIADNYQYGDQLLKEELLFKCKGIITCA